jgi:hypothetical protein
MAHLPVLPLGEQSFSELRNTNSVYVDKTHFIERLCFIERQKFVFLPRPRRFGKSLLISTLKELFLGKKDLFAGLYIEDKIEWEEYPVLHFDFSNMGFSDVGLYAAIDMRLEEIAESYGISLAKESIALKFSELMESLCKKTGKGVVILIDEYDKPITAVLEVGENKKAREHQEVLRDFYSVVKGNSGYIHLFFMTCLLRFSPSSAFSEFNNLTTWVTFLDFASR